MMRHIRSQWISKKEQERKKRVEPRYYRDIDVKCQPFKYEDKRHTRRLNETATLSDIRQSRKCDSRCNHLENLRNPQFRIDNGSLESRPDCVTGPRIGNNGSETQVERYTNVPRYITTYSRNSEVDRSVNRHESCIETTSRDEVPDKLTRIPLHSSNNLESGNRFDVLHPNSWTNSNEVSHSRYINEHSENYPLYTDRQVANNRSDQTFIDPKCEVKHDDFEMRFDGPVVKKSNIGCEGQFDRYTEHNPPNPDFKRSFNHHRWNAANASYSTGPHRQERDYITERVAPQGIHQRYDNCHFARDGSQEYFMHSNLENRNMNLVPGTEETVCSYNYTNSMDGYSRNLGNHDRYFRDGYDCMDRYHHPSYRREGCVDDWRCTCNMMNNHDTLNQDTVNRMTNLNSSGLPVNNNLHHTQWTGESMNTSDHRRHISALPPQGINPQLCYCTQPCPHQVQQAQQSSPQVEQAIPQQAWHQVYTPQESGAHISAQEQYLSSINKDSIAPPFTRYQLDDVSHREATIHCDYTPNELYNSDIGPNVAGRCIPHPINHLNRNLCEFQNKENDEADSMLLAVTTKPKSDLLFDQPSCGYYASYKEPSMRTLEPCTERFPVLSRASNVNMSERQDYNRFCISTSTDDTFTTSVTPFRDRTKASSRKINPKISKTKRKEWRRRDHINDFIKRNICFVNESIVPTKDREKRNRLTNKKTTQTKMKKKPKDRNSLYLNNLKRKEKKLEKYNLQRLTHDKDEELFRPWNSGLIKMDGVHMDPVGQEEGKQLQTERGNFNTSEKHPGLNTDTKLTNLNSQKSTADNLCMGLQERELVTEIQYMNSYEGDHNVDEEYRRMSVTGCKAEPCKAKPASVNWSESGSYHDIKLSRKDIIEKHSNIPSNGIEKGKQNCNTICDVGFHDTEKSEVNKTIQFPEKACSLRQSNLSKTANNELCRSSKYGMKIDQLYKKSCRKLNIVNLKQPSHHTTNPVLKLNNSVMTCLTSPVSSVSLKSLSSVAKPPVRLHSNVKHHNLKEWEESVVKKYKIGNGKKFNKKEMIEKDLKRTTVKRVTKCTMKMKSKLIQQKLLLSLVKKNLNSRLKERGAIKECLSAKTQKWDGQSDKSNVHPKLRHKILRPKGEEKVDQDSEHVFRTSNNCQLGSNTDHGENKQCTDNNGLLSNRGIQLFPLETHVESMPSTESDHKSETGTDQNNNIEIVKNPDESKPSEVQKDNICSDSSASCTNETEGNYNEDKISEMLPSNKACAYSKINIDRSDSEDHQQTGKEDAIEKESDIQAKQLSETEVSGSESGAVHAENQDDVNKVNVQRNGQPSSCLCVPLTVCEIRPTLSCIAVQSLHGPIVSSTYYNKKGDRQANVCAIRPEEKLCRKASNSVDAKTHIALLDQTSNFAKEKTDNMNSLMDTEEILTDLNIPETPTTDGNLDKVDSNEDGLADVGQTKVVNNQMINKHPGLNLPLVKTDQHAEPKHCKKDRNIATITPWNMSAPSADNDVSDAGYSQERDVGPRDPIIIPHQVDASQDPTYQMHFKYVDAKKEIDFIDGTRSYLPLLPTLAPDPIEYIKPKCISSTERVRFGQNQCFDNDCNGNFYPRRYSPTQEDFEKYKLERQRFCVFNNFPVHPYTHTDSMNYECCRKVERTSPVTKISVSYMHNTTTKMYCSNNNPDFVAVPLTNNSDSTSSLSDGRVGVVSGTDMFDTNGDQAIEKVIEEVVAEEYLDTDSAPDLVNDFTWLSEERLEDSTLQEEIYDEHESFSDVSIKHELMDTDNPPGYSEYRANHPRRCPVRLTSQRRRWYCKRFPLGLARMKKEKHSTEKALYTSAVEFLGDFDKNNKKRTCRQQKELELNQSFDHQTHGAEIKQEHVCISKKKEGIMNQDKLNEKTHSVVNKEKKLVAMKLGKLSEKMKGKCNDKEETTTSQEGDIDAHSENNEKDNLSMTNAKTSDVHKSYTDENEKVPKLNMTDLLSKYKLNRPFGKGVCSQGKLISMREHFDKKSRTKFVKKHADSIICTKTPFIKMKNLDSGNKVHSVKNLDSGNKDHGAKNLDSGNKGHSVKNLDSWNKGHGAKNSDSGNKGHGAKNSDSGNLGHGAMNLDSGNKGHGAKNSDSGNKGHGAKNLDSGNKGHGAKNSDSGNKGHGVKNSDSGKNLDSGNKGHGAKNLDSGNKGYGAKNLDNGIKGHGAKNLDSGNKGHGAKNSDSGNKGHGAKNLDSGNKGHGAKNSDSGNKGHGAKNLDSGNKGHGAKNSDSGNKGHGAKNLDSGNKGHSARIPCKDKEGTAKLRSPVSIDKYMFCKVCEDLLKVKRHGLHYHFTRCHETWCFRCQKDFEDRDTRMRHIKRNHDIPIFCGICGVSFVYKRNYNKHCGSAIHLENMTKFSSTVGNQNKNRLETCRNEVISISSEKSSDETIHYISSSSEDVFTSPERNVTVVKKEGKKTSPGGTSVGKSVTTTTNHGTNMSKQIISDINLVNKSQKHIQTDKQLLGKQATKHCSPVIIQATKQNGTTNSMVKQATKQNGTTNAMVKQATKQNGTTNAMVKQATKQNGTTNAMVKQATKQNGTTNAMVKQATKQNGTANAIVKQATKQNGTTNAMVKHGTKQNGTTNAMVKHGTKQNGTTNAIVKHGTKQNGTTNAIVKHGTKRMKQSQTGTPMIKKATKRCGKGTPTMKQATKQNSLGSPTMKQATKQSKTFSPIVKQATKQIGTGFAMVKQAIKHGQTTTAIMKQNGTSAPLVKIVPKHITTGFQARKTVIKDQQSISVGVNDITKHSLMSELKKSPKTTPERQSPKDSTEKSIQPVDGTTTCGQKLSKVCRGRPSVKKKGKRTTKKHSGEKNCPKTVETDSQDKKKGDIKMMYCDYCKKSLKVWSAHILTRKHLFNVKLYKKQQRLKRKLAKQLQESVKQEGPQQATVQQEGSQQALFQQEPPQQATFQQEAPQQATFQQEAPQQATFQQEAPQQALFQQEAPQQALFQQEPPQQALFQQEPPQQALFQQEPPQQATFQQEAPQQALFQQEPPQQATFQQEAPQQATFQQEAPQQATFQQEAPQQATFQQEAPQQATFQQEAPQQATFQQEPPQQATFQQEPPQQATIQQEAPQQATFQQEAPQQATFQQEAQQQALFQQEAPQQALFQQEAPQKATFQQEAPQQATFATQSDVFSININKSEAENGNSAKKTEEGEKDQKE